MWNLFTYSLVDLLNILDEVYDTEVFICMKKAFVGFLETLEYSPFYLTLTEIQMALVWNYTK